MYTRCPGCHTVHPVNAAVLAQAGGRARCGKCNKAVNTLESLFDSWPDPGTRPAPSRSGDASPPELGANIDIRGGNDVHADSAGINEMDSAGEDDGQAATTVLFSKPVWAGAAALLLVLSGISIATLPGANPPPVPRFSDISSIELVSRDMQVHPNRPGGLVLSATLVNRAEQSQDFPVLEVILTDKRSRPIANRHFQPREYLADGADDTRGMTPDALLAVTLDLLDPGAEAVGFELRLHSP